MVSVVLGDAVGAGVDAGGVMLIFGAGTLGAVTGTGTGIVVVVFVFRSIMFGVLFLKSLLLK